MGENSRAQIINDALRVYARVTTPTGILKYQARGAITNSLFRCSTYRKHTESKSVDALSFSHPQKSVFTSLGLGRFRENYRTSRIIRRLRENERYFPSPPPPPAV